MKIFVSLGDESDAYEAALIEALTDPSDRIVNKAEDAEFLIYSPQSPIRDFSDLPDLKFVQSIWAGVDSIVENKSLKVPLARLVDEGLAEGMREYVMGHILADHIEIPRFEKAAHWDDRWLSLAKSKTIGIIGIGTLGQSVADAAQSLGFGVLGWSKNPKALTYPTEIGADGLKAVLTQSDYVVTLLPHTAETEDIVDRTFLAQMKNDAMLINPGRGALLDEDALIEALDSGEIRRAVLDVFKTEPLPPDHPFWKHDKILVTPHIAAKSRLETAIHVILENLRRLKACETPIYLVDRDLGY